MLCRKKNRDACYIKKKANTYFKTLKRVNYNFKKIEYTKEHIHISVS